MNSIEFKVFRAREYKRGYEAILKRLKDKFTGQNVVNFSFFPYPTLVKRELIADLRKSGWYVAPMYGKKENETNDFVIGINGGEDNEF